MQYWLSITLVSRSICSFAQSLSDSTLAHRELTNTQNKFVALIFSSNSFNRETELAEI